MTCATCWNCGIDLSPFEPIRRGSLFMPDRVTVEWRGQTLHFTPQQRLILLAIVRADGVTVRRNALLEASGSESDYRSDPSNVVDVQLSRIRHVFREVDRMFDQIETVPCEGVRWRGDA